MNAIAQMQEWIDETKATEKDLSKLEREAKKLCEKQEIIRAERDSLRRGIGEHEESIRALEQEDSGLKNDLLEAMLSDDVSMERNLKQRRKQIANEVEEHRTGIRKLSDALDNLEDTEQKAATIAARLDALDFGYAFGFGSRLRDALVQNELRLKSRQSTARLSLPKYDEGAYQGVCAELNPKQVERERREQQRLDELDAQRKAKIDKKNAAASKEYVGAGAFGGNRRTEPDARDFSS